MPETDAELLRRFIRSRDEDAFRTLADRYLGLIYNAALRRSGHRQIAEEAAQNVLGLLVRKAPDLVHETAILPGWLHRAATLEAANLLRIERRHQNGKEALMREITAPLSCPEPMWKRVVPHLDAALARLPAIDRSIILMHYLQGKTHSEIAATVGKSASTVQRQCHRSIGKLARMLKARGVTISATSLASFLSTESGAAPAGLLTKVIAGALSNPETLTLPFISKLLLLMTTTQKVILTASLITLLASIVIVLQQIEIDELQARLVSEAPSASAPETSDRLHAEVPNPPQNDISPRQGSTASDDVDITQAKAELEAAQSKLDQLSRPFTESIFSSVVEAELERDEVLVVGGFPLENGNYLFTFLSPEPEIDSDGRELINIGSRIFELTPDAIAGAGLDALATNAKNTLQHAEAWKKDDYQTTLSRFAEQTGNSVLACPSVRTLPGHDVSISAGTFSVALTIANRETEPGYHLTTRIEMADTLPSGEEQVTP